MSAILTSKPHMIHWRKYLRLSATGNHVLGLGIFSSEIVGLYIFQM